MDAVEVRLYSRALANQLAIAVGESCSNEAVRLPSFGRAIEKEFHIPSAFDDEQFYTRWNEFVAIAETSATRATLTQFARAYLDACEPTPLQRWIAHIPISSFILATFDRSFTKALIGAGRRPLIHDFEHQAIGNWRETNPDTPSVFCMLPLPNPNNPWWSVQNQITGAQSIQISNIADMLAERDLLMLDFSVLEAEYILHLSRLALSGEKLINFTSDQQNTSYWGARGVLAYGKSPTEFVQRLLPKDPLAQPDRYGALDQLMPRTTIADMMRRHLDVFISYYSGDKAFVRQLQHDLEARHISVWRDDREIEIGDSLSEKIQSGLVKCHSMIVVLSPEALSRPWVNDELRAGYARRLGGDFKIFPVLHKDCPLPPLLADYRYADFRDMTKYGESLALLERAIKNASRRATAAQPPAG